MSNPSLLAQAKSLSPDEQLDLIHDLWDAIAQLPGTVPVTDAQKRELDRRLEAMQANPEAGEDWAQVKRRILGHNG